MKLKKFVLYGAVSALLLSQVTGPVLVLAESLPNQQTVQATEDGNITGHYTKVLKDGQWVITFAVDLGKLGDDSVSQLTLHTEQASDQEPLLFQEVAPGLYEIRLAETALTADSQLDIRLQTASRQEYSFTDLPLVKETGSAVPVSSSAASSEGDTDSSTGTAPADSSSEEVPSIRTEPLPTTEPSASDLGTDDSSGSSTADSDAGTEDSSVAEPGTQPSTSAGSSADDQLPAETTDEQVKAPQVVLQAKNDLGAFDVLFTNPDNSKKVKQVRVATWSEKNGQDDLKWYTLPISQQKGQLRVFIRDHANQADNYIVHVYVDYEGAPTVGINAGTIAIEKPAVKHDLQANLLASGLQVSLTSTEVTDYTKVRFAIWSEKNGQDDLKWYRASSTGKLTVPYKNLSDFGKYQVHAYLEDGKKMRGLTTTSFTIGRPKLDTTISKLSDTQYQIDVKGLPAYITSLQIPVWSEKNGQDDLKWYKAKKLSNGHYRVTINLLDHNFDIGQYQAHVYAETLYSKGSIGLGTIDNFKVASLGQPSATVKIENVNKQALHFDVVVSNIVAPGGLNTVQVPVWSAENGQDDLKWYTARKQANGTFKVTVSIANHKYSFGTYHAHAYLNLKTKGMAGVGSTSVQISRPANISKIQSTYQGMGNYHLTVSPVLTSGQLRIAVWSEVGGQDDLRWYDGYRQQGVVFASGFNAQNHSGTGTYQVHAYELVNGQMRGLTTTTVHVAKSHYQAPYFSQLDNRWRGLYYGSWTFGPTGCVPTVMAMIISGIKGTTVSPVQVGNYLHYQTLEFNRNFLGTSSRGVVMAARNWGLKASALNSYTALENALKQGYYVAAGVGPSKYIVAGGHEIVLKGYQNGMTYVLDPYNPNNNGWTRLSYIWSVPSTDPIDRTEGMPFIRISD